jgi:hypothetical protein
MVTCVPSGPVVGLKLLMTGGGGITVNELPLAPVPVTVVTLIKPLVAPPGTVALICPSLSTLNVVAAVPLNFTAVVAEKPLPLMEMFAPTRPEAGAKLVTAGGTPTMKFVPLVPVPVAVVTEIAPVVALVGTVAVMEVLLQFEIAEAGVPLNFTVLVS